MKKTTLLTIFLLLIGCSDTGSLLDLALNPPSRKQIDTSLVGVNNFFVNNEFGSISSQYSEIRNTLGLRYVRVLFAWSDAVQPSPGSSPNFSFYDNIISNIPAGVDVLITVSHTPNWMSNPANWINGNPRETWVRRWLQPVAQRYGQNGRVIGFEVFNEPDLIVVNSDNALDIGTPENYLEMLRFGSAAIRQFAPGKLVLNAATTSIQQRFSTTLDFNKKLVELGASDLVDVWNIHFYAESYENVVISKGVAPFLNSLGKPIWVTESGKQGPNEQLAYVETAWPFLKGEIPNIERFYYYQFGETILPVENNFGLKTTDPSFPVSDLYVHLRDRAAS